MKNFKDKIISLVINVEKTEMCYKLKYRNVPTRNQYI